MKNFIPALVAAFTLTVATSHAALFAVAFSPVAGRALNLGTNPYTRDHGVGLSGLNEPGMFTGVGSGNAIGAGLTYNDTTNLLTFDFAYGAAFGFADLAGNFSDVHFHAPGSVLYTSPNSNGGVIQGLSSFHTGSGTKSGRIAGSITLNDTNETNLINNLVYANIHSSVQGGGEIRGQLILVPEPTSCLLGMLGATALLAFRFRK